MEQVRLYEDDKKIELRSLDSSQKYKNKKRERKKSLPVSNQTLSITAFWPLYVPSGNTVYLG